MLRVFILLFLFSFESHAGPYELYQKDERMLALKNPDLPKSSAKKYIGWDNNVSPCPEDNTEVRFMASEQLNNKYYEVKYDKCHFTENEISYNVRIVKKKKDPNTCNVVVTFVCGNGSGNL